MNQLLRKAFDWTVSHLSSKNQILLTRYGLWAWTCLGRRRFPVIVMRGPTNPSGQTGTLLVAGHDPWVRYVPNRFFKSEPQREHLGHVLLRELPGLLNRLHASVDLAVVRADRWSAQKLFGNDYLSVPEWLGMRLAVPEDLETWVRKNRSIREDMRLARRHKLQPLITQDEEGFDEFYDFMYLPFTQFRYGEMGVVWDRHHLRRRLRRGGILWILRENYRLAAMLFERKNDLLDLLAIGMVTGEELPLKMRGIMAALYFFTIEHARQLGFREIDFRGSRPSLHDGLFRYKRKWGNTLYKKPDTYYDLFVRWNTLNPVVKEFLSHTGLIFREKDGLSAIYSDALQDPRSLWIEGLSRLYLLTEAGRRIMIEKGKSSSINGIQPFMAQSVINV